MQLSKANLCHKVSPFLDFKVIGNDTYTSIFFLNTTNMICFDFLLYISTAKWWNSLTTVSTFPSLFDLLDAAQAFFYFHSNNLQIT